MVVWACSSHTEASCTLTRVVDTLKVYPASRGTPKEESMTTTSTLSTEPTSSGIGVYSRPLPICGSET